MTRNDSATNEPVAAPSSNSSSENPAAEIPNPLFGSCPLPIFQHKNIVLGHGSGGKLTSELIDKVFLRAFANPILDKLDDQAVLQINGARLAFTTDSFVVTPIFFPGGDIGTLAINGTVNDLAMSGARPLYLAAAFILEEGLPAEELRRVVESMGTAAREAGVQLVTGDTKVVNRGKGDKVFITTTGIGAIERDVNISANRARPGDKILLSGYIGDHGMAIMSTRENLEFEGAIESDCAALNGLVDYMLDACDAVALKQDGDHPLHCMRDPTRGGVATTLERNRLPIEGRHVFARRPDSRARKRTGCLRNPGLGSAVCRQRRKAGGDCRRRSGRCCPEEHEGSPTRPRCENDWRSGFRTPRHGADGDPSRRHAHFGRDVRRAAAQNLLAVLHVMTAAAGRK